MFEIRNRNTLQSKNNVSKSDVKIGDCAHSLMVNSQDSKKEENAWFHKEIENAIKLRKSYNRQKRSENN